MVNFKDMVDLDILEQEHINCILPLQIQINSKPTGQTTETVNLYISLAIKLFPPFLLSFLALSSLPLNFNDAITLHLCVCAHARVFLCFLADI